MENTITVTIPSQGFEPRGYLDGRDCYLAKALRDAGYDNAVVGACGEVEIDGVIYNPTEPFDFYTVRDSFTEGKDITVTLTKTS